MTIEPPEAKKIPSPRTFHGDTVIDEYAWLADRQDPDTISYLKAENAYTDALTPGRSRTSSTRCTAGARSGPAR